MITSGAGISSTEGDRKTPRGGGAPLVTGEVFYAFAYFAVHSLAVWMAAFSSSFQFLATSLARGSSGLGAPRRAWMERRMVRIWRAGDQFPVVWGWLEKWGLEWRVDTFENIQTDTT
jgi:hypothetical protein